MRSAKPERLLDYLELASTHLESKGVDSARLDAELLLGCVLGLTRVELYTNHDRPLAEHEVNGFRDLLRRRAMREPLAYIIGTREFWSLEFEVDRRVLIPRPETETLVEAALQTLACLAKSRNGAAAPAMRALDVGTGSGAVAVALAVEVPTLNVLATDVSAAALEVAPRNATKHRVTDRVEFRHGDLFDAIDARDRFDLIVSNPPYCKQSEMAPLEREVREWEPAGALVSGRDGMDASRRIIAGAPAFLPADGWLLLEVGTQAKQVEEALVCARWNGVRSYTDLAGRVRVLAAQRPVG